METHNNFEFHEVPDGDDVIAACKDCSFEIIHLHETGRVKVLDPGVPGASHNVSYIPQDGLTLTVGIGGEKGPSGKECNHSPDQSCSGTT